MEAPEDLVAARGEAARLSRLTRYAMNMAADCCRRLQAIRCRHPMPCDFEIVLVTVELRRIIVGPRQRSSAAREVNDECSVPIPSPIDSDSLGHRSCCCTHGPNHVGA